MHSFTIYGARPIALATVCVCMLAAGSSAAAAPVASAADIQQLADSVKSHPDDAQARLQLALALAKNGFRSLSADQLQEADRIQPGFVRERFHSFMRSGRQSEQRDNCKWIVFYILRQNPEDADALLLTATSLSAGGQADLSRSVLEKAIRNAPRHLGLHAELARVLNDQKQFAPAYAAAAQELALDPTSAPARFEYARALLELGNQSQFVSDTLQAAYQQDPKNRDKSLLFARCLIRQGQYQKCLPPLLYNISALAPPQEIDETDALLATVLEHLPGSSVKLQADKLAAGIPDPFMKGYFHMRLGSIFDGKAQYAQANEEYLQAIETHSPFEGSACFHLAHNLDTKFQDPQRALPYYRQAAVLKPYDNQVQRVTARMEDRCRNRPRDVAGQLKSFLWRNVNKAR